MQSRQMNPVLAIIGGTGLTKLETLDITWREVVTTPYGQPSGPVIHGVLCEQEVVFLARHGYGHNIPPHKVNYRANMWAIQALGVRQVVAVASVGSIHPDLAPGSLAFPDQIIDYTWGRRHTYHEEDLDHVTHVDFTYPYDEALRQQLIQAADAAELPYRPDGTYGATQGPRLETAAEVDRMERDGCHMVGMTGMPEAALARELGLAYATCAVSANWAAGRSEELIRAQDLERNLERGMARVRALMEHLVPCAADLHADQ